MRHRRTLARLEGVEAAHWDYPGQMHLSVLKVNRAFLRILVLLEQEVRSQNLPLVAPAESRHSAVLVDMQTLAGGRVVEVDSLEAGIPVVDSHFEEGSLEVAARSSGMVVHSSVEVHCKIPAVVGSHAADPVQGRTT